MITEQQVVMTSVLVALVGLVAFTIGLWTGHGKDREYIAELEDELAKLMALGGRPPEVAHEPWPVHVDQALTVANEEASGWPLFKRAAILANALAIAREEAATGLEPTTVIPPDQDPSVTAWTKKMAADMDRFMRDLIEGTDKQLKEITR